jgi:hypothetical protein
MEAEPGPGTGEEGEMSQPTAEEFLRNLYRMKQDCRAYLAEAERRGDLREASEFREYLERVETMIELHDGQSDP